MFEEDGFAYCVDVRNCRSVAHHFAGLDRCGIYILHFDNGEYYVGQAKDVAKRYLQHKRTWEDIVLLSFKVVPATSLDIEEARMAETLEARGFHLRNILLVSMHYGESQFDAVMSPAEQQRWFDDVHFRPTDGPRSVNDAFRAKYTRKFRHYRNMPDAEAVTTFVARYVQQAIPAARRGERDFWSVSCLPDSHLYLRVNVNKMEVLTLAHDKTALWASFHVARSPLSRLFLSSLHKWVGFGRGPQYEILNGAYAPGGEDQLWIQAPLPDAHRLLDDPRFLAAARTMNLRLMRKGVNLNARSHCYDLADHLLGDKSWGDI